MDVLAYSSVSVTDVTDNLIDKVVLEYYLSTSATELTGGSWSSDTPTWIDGQFIWQKTIIVYLDGTTDETEPICVTGQTGADGEEARNVIVNGNNIFKYNSNGACDITSTTLFVTVTDNLNIVDWEYSQDDGSNWTSLHNATSTLEISEGSNIFSNDRVLIRAVAQDKRDKNAYYYDYITVFKLRDGTAAGNNLLLSNESQQIPCNSAGTPTTGAFNLANTSVYVYESGRDITSEYTITATPNGVLGAWSNSATQAPIGNANAAQKGSYQYYWVTGWASSNNSEVAEVVFTAVKGAETLSKKMSLIKISTGADGVSPTVYSLDLSDLIVNKSYTYSSTPDSNGNYPVTNTTYSPTTITANITQTTGNTTSAFNGYIKVFKDGGTTAIASGTASAGKYTLSGIGSTHVPTSYLTFELYSGSGASDKLLDTQNVVITSDGIKGGQGIAGKDATNVVLGNYSDVIAVNTSYKVPSQTVITIPFAGYKGATKVACTISSVPTLFGVSGVITNATASADGKIVYTIPTTATCGSSTKKTDTLAFTFTCNGTNITCNYTWSIAVAATNGTSISIKSTSVTYQTSTSGTTAPTGTWGTSVPSVNKGQYLWTKTVVTYSDDTSTTSYSVSYKGTDGTNGKSISAIIPYYYLSTSFTSATGGSWTTTMPTWVDGKYLWTKTVTILSDNTTIESTAIYDKTLTDILSRTNILEKDMESLQIGGVNYLWNSGFADTTVSVTSSANKYGLYTYGSGYSCSYDKTQRFPTDVNSTSGNNSLKIIIASGANSTSNGVKWIAYGLGGENTYLHNKDQFVFSFYAKASTTITGKIRFVNEPTWHTINLTTNWQRFSVFINITSPTEISTIENCLQMYFSSTGTAYLSSCMLERGNRLTDWKPSINDNQILTNRTIGQSIDNANGLIHNFVTENTTVKTPDGETISVTQGYADIKHTIDSIETELFQNVDGRDEKGNPTTTTKWNNVINTINQNSSTIGELKTELNGTTEKLESTITQKTGEISATINQEIEGLQQQVDTKLTTTDFVIEFKNHLSRNELTGASYTFSDRGIDFKDTNTQLQAHFGTDGIYAQKMGDENKIFSIDGNYVITRRAILPDGADFGSNNNGTPFGIKVVPLSLNINNVTRGFLCFVASGGES